MAALSRHRAGPAYLRRMCRSASRAARLLRPVLALCCSVSSILAQAQTASADTTSLKKGRAWLVAGGTAAFATGSLIALDRAWYEGYTRTPFHGFNDGDEWMQVDKAGHTFSAYTLGCAGYGAFRWAGFSEHTSTWVGGGIGFLYLAGIEYLDGRSSAWGFSGWDMAANALGTGLFIGQQAAWKEQRIRVKYSSHLTRYAAARPDVLGEGLAERLLKDYNGTTIWLSADLHALGWRALPPWLGIAAGYGAEGMITARDPEAALDATFPGEHPFRQFYLAPDLTLERIPTRSKLLRTVFFVLDRVKVPLPALELRSTGDVRGHWLYF